MKADWRRRKHAHPEAFDQVSSGIPEVDLAKQLRVDKTTVRKWRDGRLPIPWWAAKLLLLEGYVRGDVTRQMTGRLAIHGLPYGDGNALRRHLERALSAALFEAMELGLVQGALTDVPRHTLEAKRPSDLSDGRGLTTVEG